MIRVRKKYKGGGIALSLTLQYLIIIAIFFSAVLYRYILTIKAENVQNSLELSNLSVYKYIDLKGLGDDIPYYTISDEKMAVAEFKNKLKRNLNLDDTLTPKSDSLIASKISIDKFIIYNVKGSMLQILTYNDVTGTFSISTEDISKKNIKTPNGFPVLRTMVHTTISFDQKLMFGEIKRVDASIDTDVTN